MKPISLSEGRQLFLFQSIWVLPVERDVPRVVA